VLMVATPAGQIHELGALLVGAAAANLGWHVTTSGASLPAAGNRRCGPPEPRPCCGVEPGLSRDDPQLEGELTRLHESLPPEVTLLAGGRAMTAYRDALEKIGAVQMNDLAHLYSALDDLRKPARK